MTIERKFSQCSSFLRAGLQYEYQGAFLDSHLDIFPVNLGAVRDEKDERFHQDIQFMEDRYQGRWDCHMMADYCWNIQRECMGKMHYRRSMKRKFGP